MSRKSPEFYRRSGAAQCSYLGAFTTQHRQKGWPAGSA